MTVESIAKVAVLGQVRAHAFDGMMRMTLRRARRLLCHGQKLYKLAVLWSRDHSVKTDPTCLLSLIFSLSS
jgi:hypothetical protein